MMFRRLRSRRCWALGANILIHGRGADDGAAIGLPVEPGGDSPIRTGKAPTFGNGGRTLANGKRNSVK